MNEVIRDYLFSHHILVNETGKEILGHSIYALYGLINDFGVRVDNGSELANVDILRYVGNQLTHFATKESFYLGFPNSVRIMSNDMKAFNQMYHYAITYGMNDFSRDESPRAAYEEIVDRVTLTKGEENIKNFSIVSIDSVPDIVKNLVSDICLATRAISAEQIEFVSAAYKEYQILPEIVKGKTNAVRLMLELDDMYFAKYLSLVDTIKLVEEINNLHGIGNSSLTKLRIPSNYRKLICKFIDMKLDEVTNEDEYAKITECFEKKKIWNGLLHNIHYNPGNSLVKNLFVVQMRDKLHHSVLSQFERMMQDGDIKAATAFLCANKGSSFVCRNLNYIISRCKDNDTIVSVLDCIKKANPIVLMQSAMRFMNYDGSVCRTFKFTKNNLVKKHDETWGEMNKRKSVITKDTADFVYHTIAQILDNLYENKKKLNVYLADRIKNVTLPIYSSSGESGLGVLPYGSRIDIEHETIRAFVYWEKVNDIDLSAFLIWDDGSQREFSWRTMRDVDENDGITFSGDVTNGYKGGSEYYDVNIEKIKRTYPSARYLLFVANVYSDCNFNQVFCRAGFMDRIGGNIGEIYEPKTVRTSFVVNGNTTYETLFAIDLDKKQMIWINEARNENLHVAGCDNYSYINKATNIPFTYEYLFTRIGNIVQNPEEADVIVSDEINIEGKEIVHSYDSEKILWYLN